MKIINLIFILCSFKKSIERIIISSVVKAKAKAAANAFLPSKCSFAARLVFR